MRIHRKLHPIPFVTILAIAASGCASPVAADSDLVLSEIYTAAALTVAAGRGQSTVTPAPVLQSTSFPTMSPYVISTATPTATVSSGSSAYEGGCDNAAYVADVTYTDGTEVTPGETFTKTWEFLNTGSCSWSSRYSVIFTSGNDMDGSKTEIDRTVAAGQYGNVSVSLTAPDEEGTYTGYWMLANAAGIPFGQQVYVQIVVEGEAATDTPTATEEEATTTPTETPTIMPPTSTPEPTEVSSAAVASATSTPQTTLDPRLEARTT